MDILAKMLMEALDDNNNTILSLLSPLMKQYAVTGGVGSQSTDKDYKAKEFIQKLPDKLKSLGLKHTGNSDAEIYVSKKFTKDLKLQITFYKNGYLAVTYYLHYSDLDRGVIFGVNADDPDRDGIYATFDLPAYVAKTILESNKVKSTYL